jgi:tetratricopeptide (TPR) repeat protein
MATLSTEYRGASFTGLSKIYFSEGDLDNAIVYARKALEVNTNNTEAEQIIATACRISGEKEKAMASLARLINTNPLNHFIRFEQYRWQPSDATKAAFQSMIKNELSTETYLQLADWYYSLGKIDESLAVLLLAPENPEVYYWIAFLKSKLKNEDVPTYIEKANSLSPQLVFPFRQNSVNVLRWAIDHSNSWKPKYYLALIYWNRNNLVKAKELFTQCGNPDYAPLYAAKASLFADQNYIADIRRAAELDPKEWRYGKLWINRLVEEKRWKRR